jgi:uncharacterized RDD family membrane protein YckC
MQTIKIQTTQNIEVEYQLAGVGDRMVAYLVDIAIYIGFWFLLLLLNKATSFLNNNYLAFLASFPFLFYSVCCEFFLNGQTIGKKAKGIQVISLDGGQASLGQYLIRWVFSIIDVSVSSGVVAVVMIALTDKSQRLGDKVAGTTVVRTRIKTTLQDTIFEETADIYQPLYPQVNILKEKDIALVKEVLNRNYKIPNYEMIVKTADKIKQVLEIVTPHEAEDFLKTVIKDYNHVTARM